MKTGIKTYNSEDFRKEYFNASPELERLFEKSVEDFFCLRIEDLTERVVKPISPSREESHTLIFVTHGSYTTKVGFKEYTVTPRQVVIYQAGAVFSTEDVSKRVKGFTCHFHPDLLIGTFGNRLLISEFAFLRVGSHPIIEVEKHSEVAIQNLFERLCAEFMSEGKPNATVVHAYLYALLAELKVLTGPHNLANPSAASLITSHFRKLAHENAKKNLSIDAFAERMNISPNHLNKSVKHTTGKSASEIYNEIKLIEIKFLLYQSNLPISTISYEMGYSDPSYFTRFFKRLTNLSPSDFRAMIEKS